MTNPSAIETTPTNRAIIPFIRKLLEAGLLCVAILRVRYTGWRCRFNSASRERIRHATFMRDRLVSLPSSLLKNSVYYKTPMEFSVGADVNIVAGGSKRPLFSPAQPRRAKTRLSTDKAAASEDRRRYPPHFVGPFALAIGLGERKAPCSDSDIRGVHSIR